MRQGTYEYELECLTREFKNIPKQLTEIKHRGRKIRKCQKDLRVAQIRFEIARRNCLNLPKSWECYHAHGKHKNLYARPEVQEIYNALHKLEWPQRHLKDALESYQDRLTDRKALKERLKVLPDEIALTKMLADAEAQRRAAREAKAKPKDWKNKWFDVSGGFVIEAKKIKAYLRTFDRPIPFDENTVTIREEQPDRWNERRTFIFKPCERMTLKLPCYTWEQAEKMAHNC